MKHDFEIIKVPVVLALRRLKEVEGNIPSERLSLMNAATIAMLREQATGELLEGKAVDQKIHRRNVR